MSAPERHRELANLLDVQPTSHVADLGCGRGDTLLEIAALLGPSGSLVGVDHRPSPPPAPLAGDPRLTLTGADLAEPLPFEAGTFDRVVCQNVLECLADPDALISEIWRALAPGTVGARPQRL